LIFPIFAVIKKELTSVVRDGTIVISILIQLFIASFSSGLLLGMLSLYDPDTIMQFGGNIN
jgi:ABC-2 type transport system permease protein